MVVTVVLVVVVVVEVLVLLGQSPQIKILLRGTLGIVWYDVHVYALTDLA